MPRMLPPRRRPPRQVGIAIAAFLLLLIFGRSICGVIIDYAWWRELGQIDTWWRIALYRNVPGIAAWLIVFMVLWISHARGMRHAGARLREHPLYGWVVTLALAVVSIIIALAAIDGWVIVRYFGGHGQTISEWTDPQFGQPLGFYFFDLPLYSMLIDFLATCALGGALVYYLAARGWQLRRDFPNFSGRSEIDLSDLRSLGRLESGVLRGLTA